MIAVLTIKAKGAMPQYLEASIFALIVVVGTLSTMKSKRKLKGKKGKEVKEND